MVRGCNAKYSRTYRGKDAETCHKSSLSLKLKERVMWLRDAEWWWRKRVPSKKKHGKEGRLLPVKERTLF